MEKMTPWAQRRERPCTLKTTRCWASLWVSRQCSWNCVHVSESPPWCFKCRTTWIRPWTSPKRLLGCWPWTTCCTWPRFTRTPTSGLVLAFLILTRWRETSAASPYWPVGQIVLENSSREDKHECPFGRCAIELTRMLCEILQVGELREYGTKALALVLLIHSCTGYVTTLRNCCTHSHFTIPVSQLKYFPFFFCFLKLMRAAMTTTPCSSLMTEHGRNSSVSASSCLIKPGRRWEPQPKTSIRLVFTHLIMLNRYTFASAFIPSNKLVPFSNYRPANAGKLTSSGLLRRLHKREQIEGKRGRSKSTIARESRLLYLQDNEAQKLLWSFIATWIINEFVKKIHTLALGAQRTVQSHEVKSGHKGAAHIQALWLRNMAVFIKK